MKLAVGLSRIDVVPKNIQQLFIGDLRRIVGHFDRLAVLGFVGGDKIVIGRLLASAGVADHRFRHSFGLVKRRLHAPETAPGEDRGFRFAKGA